MAESSPKTQEMPSARTLNSGRWTQRPLVALVAVMLVGAALPGEAQPPPPAIAAERTRIAGLRVFASSVAALPARLARLLIRLLLAGPAIRATPTCRSDTPVLPTVGRPRDVPARRASGAWAVA